MYEKYHKISGVNVKSALNGKEFFQNIRAGF